jgi:IS1 family transposase
VALSSSAALALLDVVFRNPGEPLPSSFTVGSVGFGGGKLSLSMREHRGAGGVGKTWGSARAERGIDISHETVRYWWNRFGPMFAAEIRRKRVQQMRSYSNWQWHLDEVFVSINSETHSLWRAVDHEGEVLESFVAKRRDSKAALNVLKTSMKRHGRPHTLVTDKLRSYGAAMKVVGNANRQETGRWENNRAENAHPLPDSGLLANHDRGPF